MNGIRRFGLRMDGCEADLERLVLSVCGRFSDVTLIEVGTARGETLKAIFDVLSEGVHTLKWKLIGLDLRDGWSLDLAALRANFAEGLYFRTVEDGEEGPLDTPTNVPAVFLLNSRLFFQRWAKPIHFCLIDGCHGKACVKADFEGVERLVPNGGIVVFHDAGVIEQGTDWQPHCGAYIGVRDALKDLGLLEGTRPGWKRCEDIIGNRGVGGDGNSCTVFLRT